MRQKSYHHYFPAAIRPATETLGRRLREAQHVWMNVITRPNSRAIFVLGNQKSGTTAIAGLFARMTGQSVTLDLLPEVRRPVFQKIPSGEVTFEDLVRRNRWGFSRDVVKEPNLTLFTAQLRERFPEARFVFIMRDPRDNLRSILNAVKLPGSLTELEPDAINEERLANAEGWRLVIDGSWYGIPGENYIESLAHRWRVCQQIHATYADEMILIRYEDFVADKLGSLRELAAKLSSPEVQDVVALLDVPFQPRGDRSTNWNDFFGETNLRKIESICKDGMAAMGYAPSL